MKTSCVSSLICVLTSLVAGAGCSAGGDPTGDDSPSGGGHATGGSGGSAGGSSAAGGASAGTGGSVTSAGAAGTSGMSGQGGSGAGGQSGAGAGGGGGSGGSVPHNVLDCEGLGDVGVWEKISPNDYTAHGSIVDPINSGTVYVGCGAADGFFNPEGVWKTTDCGANWVKIATGEGADYVNTGRQWAWLMDPVTPDVVYTVSGYGYNGFYKSTDGGVSWADVTPKGDGAPGFVGGPEQMDPEDPQHLLLTWHSPCGVYEDHIGCFSESHDGGATWTEHWGDPDWSEEVRPYLLHGDTWILPSEGLQRTTDAGETWTKVSDNVAGGHSSGNIYRSPTGAYYIGSGNGVLKSSDDGETWTLGSSSGQYVMGIVGDGTTIYASAHGGVVTSPETDGVEWSILESPFADISEGCFLGYDPDHHLLYASCHGGSYPDGSNGMWRMRTE